MKKLYFAYGSNLNATDWQRYCSERKISPHGLIFKRVAWLPDFEVSFHYYSKTRDGGALTIHPRPGTAVPGALYEADEATWAALDRKEGVASGFYERLKVIALDEDGLEYPCTSYQVTQAARTQAPVPPANGYHEVVSRALQSFKLPTSQLDSAARGLEPKPLPSTLFTYGTLMQNQARWPDIADMIVKPVTSAKCKGSLWEVEDYPGLINDEGLVHGELAPMALPEKWVQPIDEIEGFLGYGKPHSLYRRIIRKIQSEKKTVHGWTYLYLGSTSGLLKIDAGDWRLHKT
ncbi:MAG: hypothetical protein CL917_16505 [Deltaproteobacteria bacterium]|nr:hypothetical protein [Deltaproteobacteria bacterium]